MANSKNDNIYYVDDAAYTGTIDDRERQRLLVKLGLTEPQNLSLQDLYYRALERPRLP